jgi:hypothetical protein
MATEQWRWRRRLYPMGHVKGRDVPRRGWRAEPVAFIHFDLQAKEEEQ